MPIGATTSTGGRSAAGGGGGGSASDVRAGGAYVELTARDKLSHVLLGIQKRAHAFAGVMSSIGVKSLAVGASLGAPLTAIFKEGVDRAADLKDMAEIFGITTEAASKMAYVFEVAGGGMEDFQQAMSRMAKANTTGRPLDEFFLDVAKSLGEIDDASERFQAASEIFGGKFAARFLDAAGGLEDVKRLMGRAPILTAQQAADAERVQMAWREAGIAIKMSLIPALEFVTPLIQRFSDFIKKNAGLAMTLASVAIGFGLVGAAAYGASVAVTVASATVGTLAAILGALATPIGIATVAVVALGAVLVTQTKTGQEAVRFLGRTFTELGAIFGATWAGILDAVKGGKLELAFEIAGAGVRVAWRQLLFDLADEWNKFIGPLVRRAAADPLLHRGLLDSALTALGPVGDLLRIADAGRGGDLIPALTDLAPDMPKMAARLVAERKRLEGLRAEAAPVPIGPDVSPSAAAAAAAWGEVKGAFQTFGAGGSLAAQMFGYGSKREKETDLLAKINDGKGDLPAKIAAAVAVALVAR